MESLTDEQVENWRRVLCAMFGPYALIMPREQVQAIRDRIQAAQHRVQPTDTAADGGGDSDQSSDREVVGG